MDEFLLKNLTEKHREYQLEADRVAFQVNSTLLIASATILAVSTIIGEGLIPQGNTLCLLHILSVLTIVINAFCILLLGIVLVGYAVRAKRIRNALWDKIEYTLHHPDEEYGAVLKTSNPKFFLVCEVVAYISFVLFIIGLAAIGLLK